MGLIVAGLKGPALPYFGADRSSSSKEHSRIQVQPARAVGPRVQIAARHRDVAMPEGRLHHGQSSTMIDGVAGKRVLGG